ncbi:hypothetical protein COHA_009939 [Chlorella ohadii]|uniref:t-SNARE coiled-coil homology domain-containing protein n=1 Tax=Chlorella ohadii TaxID=2649997 RepID=A0AAD5DEL5_9CHLO|nr:hypothetical protein COHA_009939 [Chlorella ohadii]
MNDLLGTVAGGANGAGRGGDLEAGPPPPQPPGEGNDKHMEDFFREVAAIKGMMADIRRNQGRLQEAHERSKTVTRSEEMKKLREQMQASLGLYLQSLGEDITAVSKSADAIKKRLAELDRSNEQSLKRKGCGPGSSSERTRTAITGALKKKLKDLMGEFQDLRSRVNAEYREVVERRVYTVTGQHADEEQIEKMIETGESETIFQKAILEQGRGYVLDTLAEIRERRDAVLELERSLMELHQIFLDMAVLVEAQGEMLDNIEAQVAKSVEYVQAGTTHLVAAKRLQKNTRKWMCCALILLIIIAAAIAIPIALKLTK